MPGLQGRPAKPESLAVTLGGINISELTRRPIRDELAFLDQLQLTEREHMIAERMLKEIRARLQFLVDVGLDYLTLDRASGTLAGGEAQRIRLATQIGSGLVGRPVHPGRAVASACTSGTTAGYRHADPAPGPGQHADRRRARRGDDPRPSDHVVDIGPGAGELGGARRLLGRLQGLAGRRRGLADRRVPVGPAVDPHAAGAPASRRASG